MKAIPIYSHRARLFQTHAKYENQLESLAYHIFKRRQYAEEQYHERVHRQNPKSG